MYTEVKLGGNVRQQTQSDPTMSGEYRTVAQLAPGDNSVAVETPSGLMGTLNPGIYATVVVVDDRAGANETRMPVLKVRVSVPWGSQTTGFPAWQRFSLTAPSYQVFKDAVNEYANGSPRAAQEQLSLLPQGREPVTANRAIPTPVRVRDGLGSLASSPSPMCRRFNMDLEEMNRNLGLLHNRDDIQVIQGSQPGASAGVLVHQQDGNVYMFDSTGQQHIALGNEGMRAQTYSYDTGQAVHRRSNVTGIPMRTNPVLDYVPNGTIVTPQPALIPDFTRLASTILTVCDMVDLVKTCKAAVDVWRGKKTPQEVLAMASRESALERAYYGISERPTRREGESDESYNQRVAEWQDHMNEVNQERSRDLGITVTGTEDPTFEQEETAMISAINQAQQDIERLNREITTCRNEYEAARQREAYSPVASPSAPGGSQQLAQRLATLQTQLTSRTTELAQAQSRYDNYGTE